MDESEGLILFFSRYGWPETFVNYSVDEIRRGYYKPIQKYIFSITGMWIEYPNLLFDLSKKYMPSLKWQLESEKITKNLSKGEKEFIDRYGNYSYQSINSSLRANHCRNISDTHEEELIKIIRNNTEKHDGFFVHRIVDHFPDLKVGDLYLDYGFISTSILHRVFGNFRGRDYMYMKIYVRPNNPALYCCPGNWDETEILLPPASLIYFLSNNMSPYIGKEKKIHFHRTITLVYDDTIHPLENKVWKLYSEWQDKIFNMPDRKTSEYILSEEVKKYVAGKEFKLSYLQENQDFLVYYLVYHVWKQFPIIRKSRNVNPLIPKILNVIQENNLENILEIYKKLGEVRICIYPRDKIIERLNLLIKNNLLEDQTINREIFNLELFIDKLGSLSFLETIDILLKIKLYLYLRDLSFSLKLDHSFSKVIKKQDLRDKFPENYELSKSIYFDIIEDDFFVNNFTKEHL